MTIRETLIAFMSLGLLLTTAPAFTCGNGECDPEPPAPPPAVTPSQPDGDSAYDPYQRQYFGVCTCTDMRVAWGFETLAFRKQAAEHQCRLRRERIGCRLSDQDYAPEGLK